MNELLSLVTAIITAIIGFVVARRRYNKYYQQMKEILDMGEKVAKKLNMKETKEFLEALTKMLKDDKITNKEIKRVMEEAEDVYMSIMHLFNKNYGDD